MQGEDLLAQVEAALLPKIIHEEVVDKKHDFQSTPKKRFQELLFELIVADHVRASQTIYRDSYDEQNLFEELRGFGSSITRIKTKDLLEKIIEGRTRLAALAKLSFGKDHISTWKARLDLGTAYAYHGLWPQGLEKANELLETLKNHSSPLGLTPAEYAQGFDCANRIVKVYRCLRTHVQVNCGKVYFFIIKEIVSELEAEMKSDSGNAATANPTLPSAIASNNAEEKIPNPSRFAAALHAFFSAPSSKIPLKKFSTSYYNPDGTVNINLPGDAANNSNSSTNRDEMNSRYRPWGEVIDFLRNKCEVFRIWLDCAESILLPQNKAILMMPFRYCDPSNRNLAHCVQLSNEISKFPSAYKIISGSQFLKKIAEMNKAIPVDSQLFRKNTNSNDNSLVINNNNNNNNANNNILYELPITLEEYLCYYLLECRNYVTHQGEMVLIQTMTLCGICSSYLDHQDAAETLFTEALHKLEHIGLDMELCACELFNSIAQLMMSKYSKWLNHKKEDLKAEIEEWMDKTEEGKRNVRLQIRNIKRQFAVHTKMLPLTELQHQAKQIIYKTKMKDYFNHEQQGEYAEMRKLLNVAARYLMKTFEILESYHSSSQAIVGTACLAVASVQNLMKDYAECREWLLKALRVFERSNPLPIRAISFTQIQLANVLKKLSHEDEARRVLLKAMEFHRSQARIGILQNPNMPSNNLTGGGGGGADGEANHTPSLFPLIFKNTSLYEELEAAMKLSREVIDLSIKCGDKWEASLYAEDLSKLVESAFGWDSIEAAETYKDVGSICVALEDWTRAQQFYGQSLQSYASVYDQNHPKYVHVQKLIEHMKKKSDEAAKPIAEKA